MHITTSSNELDPCIFSTALRFLIYFDLFYSFTKVFTSFNLKKITGIKELLEKFSLILFVGLFSLILGFGFVCCFGFLFQCKAAQYSVKTPVWKDTTQIYISEITIMIYVFLVSQTKKMELYA